MPDTLFMPASRILPHDRLIIATGAVPVRPTLPGFDLSGVYLLRTMEDSFAFNEHLRTQNPRSVVIVGGGYIGMEMADALTHRGLAITVVEHGNLCSKRWIKASVSLSAMHCGVIAFR